MRLGCVALLQQGLRKAIAQGIGVTALLLLLRRQAHLGVGPGGVAGPAPTAVEGALGTGAQAQHSLGGLRPPGPVDLCRRLDPLQR